MMSYINLIITWENLVTRQNNTPCLMALSNIILFFENNGLLAHSPLALVYNTRATIVKYS